MPKPVSLLVGNTMGCAPTCLRATASAVCDGARHAAVLEIVGLGQDELVRHRGGIEVLHRLAVAVLHAVARIDQQADALERRAAAQEGRGEILPGLLHRPRHLREAVARQIDQGELAAEIEEIDLPRMARAGRGRAPGCAGRSARSPGSTCRRWSGRRRRSRAARSGSAIRTKPPRPRIRRGRRRACGPPRSLPASVRLLSDRASALLLALLAAATLPPPPPLPLPPIGGHRFRRRRHQRLGLRLVADRRAVLAHDVILLRDRQRVAPRPVDHQAGLRTAPS